MRFKQATRNAFASQSSGASYLTKGEAIARFDAVLRPYNVTLSAMDTSQMHGDEGRLLMDVVNLDENGDELNEAVARALFTWYRLPVSGRWEIVGYLA